MNKKNIYLLIIITLLLGSNFSFAQPIELKELLQQVDISLNSIKTVTYKVDYFNKYLARKPEKTHYIQLLFALY